MIAHHTLPPQPHAHTQSSGITIEVCVDSLESAVNAYRGGANRLELCANLGVGGGTTPSMGFVRAVQRALPDVPIMAMVRPRMGDFLYSFDEFDVMREDIRAFKEAGVAGVVFGILNEDGTINVGQTLILAYEAVPLQVCFHRAFDMTTNAIEALEMFDNIPGITRILTSGHGTSAPASLQTLQALLAKSQKRGCPSILPGAGINPRTARALLDALLPYGLTELHLSGGGWIDGAMKYRREGMGMGAGGPSEWGIWKTDREVIAEVRRIVDEAWKAHTGK
ncbi:hypothetical protein DENSPDRAFT_373174 [Dentipellis sp. KUC8613]|nr:hypothetical protein DENSPDRAFT_373174 [Dentipellis sp. KUC8613]